MSGGIDKLIGEIERQAEARRNGILSRAEEDIALEKKKFEEQKKELAEEAEKSFRRKGELLRSRIMTAARMEARKEVLLRKSALMEETFDLAVKELKEASGSRRSGLISRLIADTVITGSEEVLPGSAEEGVTEELIKKINSSNKWKLKLGGRAEGIEKGFILKAPDFETVVDFRAVREFLRETFERRVVKELFGITDESAG